MIACGRRHMVIQNEKNEIYVYGQLGLGDDKYRDTFEKVEYNFGEIKNIACGYNHIMIQNEKNEIYACGCNYLGQLGLGDNERRNTFEKVEYDFSEIKKIVCGAYYTVIKNKKNEVYVCGYNDLGQLGLGDNRNRNRFEKVGEKFGEIKKIECGYGHTVIQNEKNEVYVCGDNELGQLGLGDKKHRNKFEKVEYDFGKIKNIACGGNHTVIQNEKNEVYVCGGNAYGQLGLGDNKGRNKFKKMEYNFGEIKKIECGYGHTVIQNDKNEIYVCGNDEYGQLGLGDKKGRNKFEKVEYNFGEIKNITCGTYHTIIQNEKNEIYVCGWNKYGQLGLGDKEDVEKFKKVNTEDILERVHNFELELNIDEIEL